MPASSSSFTIDTATATFQATIRGASQRSDDLQRLTFGVYFDDDTEWSNLLALVTTRYHVHAVLGGSPVVDIVVGPGEGDLDVDGLGFTTAILTSLERSTYLPYNRAVGSAIFLITGLPL